MPRILAEVVAATPGALPLPDDSRDGTRAPQRRARDAAARRRSVP